MQYTDFDRFLRFPTADLCRTTKGNRCGGREEGSKQMTIHGISCGRTTGVLGPNGVKQTICQTALFRSLPGEIDLCTAPGEVRVSKYRHRLCLVTVVLALFDQAARRDRIQESAGFGLRTPVLLYSVSSSGVARARQNRSHYYGSDLCNAGAGRNADAGRSRDVSGREIRKNGLRF